MVYSLICQVAFKNFYNTKSAGDKCTLYSDRNLINRRNVRENVDAAVNPCRKFFELEIKARLIASAVHELGMNNLSDSPTGEFWQPNLPEASDIEKKEYLHKVASRVVDSYVIRRENVESIFNSLLAAEEDEASNRRNQTDDGRFICNFPGCGKTFKVNGKRLRDHESTHSPPISTSDSQQSLFSNFFDAIREGDGKRIFRCWKFQLPYLRNDGGSTKYALEALGMMFQIYGLLSPKHSHELIWNRTALLRSGLGNNIPLDLLLEFFNRLLKEVQRKLGPNATNQKAIGITKIALDNFDRECCVIRRSGQHYEISVASDLQKIAVEIISQKAFTWTPGRSYEQFKDMDSTLLEHFDLQDMFQWINKHKRNIVCARKAR